MICARLSAVVFDAVVLVFTWWRIRHVMGMRHYSDPSEWSCCSNMRYGRATVVIMRDTALYFGILCVINVAGIVINSINISGLRGPKFVAAVSTWTGVMTSILISRLMLDIQASHDSEGSSRNSQILTTLIFDVTEADPQQVPASGSDEESAS
ncbi:hypothetical protein DAEQUDRAFT_723831 [Daedalea quercina L-15889]|uniref:Transmembrane protein n=1 Tax=Daedalea quercina L-15889 TaxID=1314783 RepID=A0A165SAP8_9APHY|nr:hypothetical protein DAEQUDRAFT_723831 [Daedalea quercina L-15889]